MHQKTQRPQRPRDSRPPFRRKQFLARTQQSQARAARPSKVQRQIRQQLTGTGAESNHYSILYDTAPPPCQVEEQERINNVNDITALEQFIKKGILDGSIPSIVADSAATSSVGTPTAPLIPTGRTSNKIFQLPDGTRTSAATVSELAHDVRQPAKEVHIVPSIKTHSLLSTAKFAEAGYITVFDDEEVNIYDAQNTTLKVSRGAIVRGWFDKTANLWRIPQIPVVLNNNTDTVLVNKQPTEFLPGRTPIIEAINNVYELKTQPELVRYLHACAGFPTKPSWIKAIKNGQYASWPGLTVKAVAKHFPESEETMKGHGRKTKSGLRSTKANADSEPDFDDIENATMNQTHSLTKQKESVLMVFDLSDKSQRLMYIPIKQANFQKNQARATTTSWCSSKSTGT
jgi:hypothetical protein